MSKMSNNIIRQREAGIKEDLTEEILIVQSAILVELRSLEDLAYNISERKSGKGKAETLMKITAYMKELEVAWDRIKRSVKGEGYGEDYQAERG